MIVYKIERRTDINGQEIRLWTHDVRESDIIFENLKKDKPIEVSIKNKRIKRSLTANAYCWVLCDKIAQKILSTKEDVYRQAIHDVGAFYKDDTDETPFYPALMAKAAIPGFRQYWEAKGIGWFIEDYAVKNMNTHREVWMYYGSSQYDTKQMARLIDSLVEEADRLDIVTKPKSDIEKLKKEWGEI